MMSKILISLPSALILLSGCSADPKIKTKSAPTTGLMGNSIQRGADGQNGVHCWEAHFIDSDGDGLPNPEFDSDSDGIADADINRDGTFTSADCLGARGIQGPQGLRGNDGRDGTNGMNGRDGTNGTNGVNCYDGLTIDLNGDGVINRLDCRGPAGANGTNGMNGSNGRDGANCFDGMDPFTAGNRDGILSVEDCQGPAANPNFNSLEVIKCRVGGEIPGGIDSTGLMNEHIQNANGTPITATAQCSPGKRLIMSTVTSVKLANNIAEGDTAAPKIDYGVASGRIDINDPYPTRIECFFENRFPTPLDPAVAGAIAVTGMGLCAPIPQ